MTARSHVRLILVLAYASLLAASCFVRSRQSVPAPTGPADRLVTMRAVKGERLLEIPVRIAYREYGRADGTLASTLVLIHGSPGHMGDFDRLGPMLGQRLHVIAPDLPGFGASTHALPDYSFRAHAVYLGQFLDALGIKRAHVLGYSMGSGVVLSFADLSPDRLASVTMLSAIGVQEMELSGDYLVNHIVHGAQLAGFWAAIDLTPHMGLFDNAMLGLPYARNFYDSDQRPLRSILRHLDQPTLIIHGAADDLVPYAAALEHHRLVPQSELLTLDGTHFELFRSAPDLASMIADFIHRVDRGAALTRATADQERVLAALPLYGTPRFPELRGIAVVVMTGLLAAGALASGALLTTATGGVVTTVRILGGVVPSAALAWIYLQLPLGALHLYVRIALFLFVTSALLTLVPPALTSNGRRLLLSRWRRITQWEFWPPWVFYPPLLLYIAYLMARYRGVTLFSAANPAIVAGGVVGESKYEILQGLSRSADFVAPATLIAGTLNTADKCRMAEAFMHDRGVAFPVVLKPDNGQRGSGVVVVRSSEVLVRCLTQSAVDTIIQEYADGPEFGVFYYRLPSETRGHILSITEKTFPTLGGDGQHTLQHLILHDDRAVSMARFYLDRHRRRLQWVPANGESVQLVEIGSHCRGSLFRDGRHLLTPALEARFDAIARGFDGFYFGRFDVRASGGVEAFRNGMGFKIVELNGVTSEAAHIYHPGTPLLSAYRDLMEQWRIAFAIGKENRARGVQPASVRELIALVRRYRQTARLHLTAQAIDLSVS